MKNILSSGCVLYPVSNTCIKNIIWTNAAQAESVSIQNEAWAKGWPDYKKKENKISQLNYSKNFYWLKTWSNNHLLKISKILFPYLFFLIILLLLVRSNSKKSKLQIHIKLLIFISFIGSLLWFFKVPVFRYGYSYLIIFISLGFALTGNYIKFKKNSYKTFRLTICALLIIFVSKNLSRIIFEDYKYNNYPWPKFYSYNIDNKINKLNFKIINGKKIYYPNDEYCMYGYAPCGKINEKLNIKIFKNYSIIYFLSN